MLLKFIPEKEDDFSSEYFVGKTFRVRAWTIEAPRVDCYVYMINGIRYETPFRQGPVDLKIDAQLVEEPRLTLTPTRVLRRRRSKPRNEHSKGAFIQHGN